MSEKACGVAVVAALGREAEMGPGCVKTRRGRPEDFPNEPLRPSSASLSRSYGYRVLDDVERSRGAWAP